MFKKVAIVGTGLIGGSLALDIRAKGLARTIVGVSRSSESVALAEKRHIIDEGSTDLSIVSGADFIILATPVSTILRQAKELRAIAGDTPLVTDVGSTKLQIVTQLTKLFPRFVGSHPLAGSEKRGVKNATAGLFTDSTCILTPSKKTNGRALAAVHRFWNLLGTRSVIMSPQAHDRILGFVSHLPHVLAFSLISSVPGPYLPYAPSSLKETTRIAASDAALWTDIFLSNRTQLLAAVRDFRTHLDRLAGALERGDAAPIKKLLEEASKKREGMS